MTYLIFIGSVEIAKRIIYSVLTRISCEIDASTK
jgi:hypothetical protein